MSATDFFDSNILLYLVSSDPIKADLTEDMLRGGGTISDQILNEVASVAKRKFGRSIAQVRILLNGIRAACVTHIADLRTHEMGLDIAERYQFSIHDSMLIAAALQAGCRTFFTEDLQHGQRIEELRILNPFRV